MKKILLAVAICLLAAQMAQAQNRISRKGAENPDKWICSAFARGTLPPFSFTLDGVPSAKFIKGWEYSRTKTSSDDGTVAEYEISWRDKESGLKVTAAVKGYSDFAAVEWTLRFTNEGRDKSGQIADVRTADFSLKEKKAAGYQLRRLMGSHVSQSDFEIVEQEIPADSTITLATLRGRSSDGVSLPFFNLTAEGAGCGAIYSIGWTGSWNASFAATDGALKVTGGLQNADFYLNAGESVRGPMTSVLFWKGDGKMAGHNIFRRFMLAHHAPKTDNGYWAPLCGGFDWGDPEPCNEYTCLTEYLARAIVMRYKQFGIVPEVFWLDAGWYGTDTSHLDGNFRWGEVGNWAPDGERFPNGLINVSNLIHSYGAKFMVWFEPERVGRGSKIDREHHDFLMENPNDAGTLIFNLGDEKALEWMCQYIGDIIESNGIDHYRQDFNAPNLDGFWAATDTEGRRGISEMKYIEGLYKYWDYLRSRFPGLQIDNCASGGRRLDIETVSRSTPLWRTDYHYGEPVGYQCHTYGLNLFLPLSGTGLYETDLYHLRSSYSSAMALNFNMLSRGQSADDMRRDVSEYLSVRDYYLKDYYPLCGYGNVTGNGRWMAYQLDDSESASGIVVAFRREGCAENTLKVELQAICPDAEYTVTDFNTGESRTLKGSELASSFSLRLDTAPESILLKYEKK